MESAEVTKAEFARLTGRSKQYIGRLCDRGTLKLADGLINIVEGIKALEGLKTNGKGSSGNGNDTNGGKPTLWDEQARLAGHKADIAEMESLKLKEKLVEVDAVVGEYDKLFTAIRQRMLSMATKLTPVLFNAKTKPALQAKLDEECHRVLNEIANYDADTGKLGKAEPPKKNKPAGKKAKASAKADSKRVGK